MAEQASAWTSSFNDGAFVRKSSEFRDHVTLDGPFAPASGRYHLYVSHACPWAHRTMLARALLGLEDAVSVSVVDWRMQTDGSWVFNPSETGATADTLHGSTSLEEVYALADPSWPQSGHIGTVPVLWDQTHGTIVNNESREIVRMLTTAFRTSGLTSGPDLCPDTLVDAIDAMIDANYESVNNGVYKTGFARSQAAYDDAVTVLFDRLDALEAHMANREWLVGEGRGVLTEADLCLVPTLLRFDLVYVVHFKCSLKRIVDMPNLSAYLERFLALPGVRSTCDWRHMQHHYFWSHEHMNPHRIVPLAPSEGIHITPSA
jgi:putative glutathione S-transferase